MPELIAKTALAGKTLIVADYGQLELRLLAHMANCASMLAAFEAGEGGLHVGHRHLHQARMAVRAAAFIADPIGAQVAFLEDMHRQAFGAGGGDGGGVHRAGVAVKHDVGDLFLRDQAAEGGRPILRGALIGDVGGACWPERMVAPVEAHAPDIGPGGDKHLTQAVKERAMRALQKQKPTALA